MDFRRNFLGEKPWIPPHPSRLAESGGGVSPRGSAPRPFFPAMGMPRKELRREELPRGFFPAGSGSYRSAATLQGPLSPNFGERGEISYKTPTRRGRGPEKSESKCRDFLGVRDGPARSAADLVGRTTCPVRQVGSDFAGFRGIRRNPL